MTDKATKPYGTRHPDLFNAEEAAAYMGTSRLDKLPSEFRPASIAYSPRLYHKGTLDRIIANAANLTEAQVKHGTQRFLKLSREAKERGVV